MHAARTRTHIASGGLGRAGDHDDLPALQAVVARDRVRQLDAGELRVLEPAANGTGVFEEQVVENDWCDGAVESGQAAGGWRGAGGKAKSALNVANANRRSINRHASCNTAERAVQHGSSKEASELTTSATAAPCPPD